MDEGMQTNFKKLISILLAGMLMLCCSLPVFAANSDYAGHWAQKSIDKWMEKGIISGYENGIFRPDNPVTKAEFTAIITRLFNYQAKGENPFSDVQEKAWYYDAVLKACSAKIVEGDGKSFNPEGKITRQEAFVILARAFDLKASDIRSADKFSDAVDIASWSRSAIAALVEKGYVSGRSGNLAAPFENLTRAETIKLVDNMTGDLVNAAGTYSKNSEGNLLVNTPSAVLKNMTVMGDLYLSQGIGSGEVTLDNVTVKGRTIIRGGGENSIIVKNSHLEGILYIVKQDGRVRIVASGDSGIGQVQMASGARLQEDGLTGSGFGRVEIIAVQPGQEVLLDGSFDSVAVQASQAVLRVQDGTIGSLTLEQAASLNLEGGKVSQLTVTQQAAGSSIQLSAGASVTILTANAAADLRGSGAIGTANINANGVSLEIKPTTVKLADNVTATIGGQAASGNTPSTGGNSGGSGNGDGGGDSTVTVTPITGANVSISKGSIDFSYRFSAGSGAVTYAQAKAAPYYLDESASTVQLKTEGIGPSVVSAEIPLSNFMIGDNGAVRYNDLSEMAAAFRDFRNPPTHILLHLKGKTSVGGATVSNPWTYDTAWIAFSELEGNIFKLYADKEALQLKDWHGADIAGTALQNISENLVLDTAGMAGGSIIAWSSSNPAVISNTGLIHQQAAATDVTLTATLSLGTYTESKTFSVKVAAVSLADAALSNIEITGGGTLRDASGQNNISFDPDTLSYSVNLNGVSAGYVGIRATARSSAATLRIDGSSTTSGAVYYKALSAGENTVSITVTSGDNSANREYALTVVRPDVGAAVGAATNVSSDSLDRYFGLRDVNVKFSPPVSESCIREYRIIAAPEPEVGTADFTCAEATPYYICVQPSGAASYSIALPADAKDMDGNAIIPGKNYNVIVLSIADGSAANVNTKSDYSIFYISDYFNVSFVEGAGNENKFRVSRATTTFEPTTGSGSIDFLNGSGIVNNSYLALTTPGALEYRLNPQQGPNLTVGDQVTLNGTDDGILTLSAAAGTSDGYYAVLIRNAEGTAYRTVGFEISGGGTKIVVKNLILEGIGNTFIIKPKSSGIPGNEYPAPTFASGSLELLDATGVEKVPALIPGSTINYSLSEIPDTIEAGDQVIVTDNGIGFITVSVTDSGSSGSTNGDYMIAIRDGVGNRKYIWFTVTNGTTVTVDAEDKEVPK